MIEVIKSNKRFDTMIRKGIVEDFGNLIHPSEKFSNFGMDGIGFHDESNGLPVVDYYFEEALGVYVRKTHDAKFYGFGKFFRDNRKRVLKLRITEDAKELVGEIGIQEMRNLGFPKKFQGRRIGSGSEGNVYRYRISDKEYAVKIFSQRKQDKINKFAEFWRMYFPEPDFIERVGYTRAIVTDLADLPKHHYTLDTLIEIGASQDFFMTAMGPLISLEDVFACLGIIEPTPVTKKRLLFANKMICDRGITKEVAKELDVELKVLIEIGSVLNYCASGFFGESYLRHDFAPCNFLVRGFDEASGTFDLVLIDQGTVPPQTSDMFYDFGYSGAVKAYESLNRVPEYSAFLEKRDVMYPVKKD